MVVLIMEGFDRVFLSDISRCCQYLDYMTSRNKMTEMRIGMDFEKGKAVVASPVRSHIHLKELKENHESLGEYRPCQN
jgi:hypothetical protein